MRARPGVFLALAILGLVAPAVFLVPFLADHGLDFGEMWDQFGRSDIDKAFIADLLFSSLVFWVWLPREAARVGVRRWWLFVLANLFLGLCVALPLFLYFRERRLAETPT